MTDLKLGIVFDVKNGRFKSEVKENAQVITQLGTSTQRTAGQTRKLSGALDTANTKLFKTSKVANGVALSLAGMASGFSAALLLKNLSDTTRTFQVLKATLITATGGIDEAADAFDRLQVFASSTPFSVEESIQAFIKLKNLGLDPTEAALNSYGNTASAMGKSLDQFIEAVADASVSEFERLKEFGIKAKNQGDTIAFTFRKITTEVGNNAEAIEQYLQNLGKNEFAGAMKRQAATYDGALSNMGDSWDQLVLKISDDGVGDAMENVVRGISSNLNFLGNNTKEITQLFEIGLVVATGHAVNALSNKTAATVKDIVATSSANQSALTLAKTELAYAQTANKRAIQEQAAAQRMLKNAANTNIRSKAITNLARANGQLVASERLVTIATNNTAIATRKANIVRSIGSALVGGLPGLLTIAAFSMYAFATSTDDAADKTKRLNEENAKLNPFANYTFKTATGALDRYKGQLKLAQQMAEETQTRFKNPFFKNVTASDVTTANKEVERLTQTITALQAIVNDKSPKSAEPPKQDKKSLDVFAQQRDALNQQLALLGKTTELAKAEYATSLGKYKDLLPAQKEELINLAKALDVKNQTMNADKLASQAAKQLNDSSNSYAQTLRKKIELTGESSNVAQLNFELEHGSLKGINDELRTQLELLAQKADNTQALADQQLPFWEQMKEHIGSTSEQFDTMWGNSFDRFSQGIGDATASAIIEGKSFGDTMKTIARSAIKEVISGLVQIGVKELALAGIKKIINKNAAVSAAGTMTAEAQASSLTAGIHAFKSTAAIPFSGPALAPGAMIAALAVTSPMVAGVAGMASSMAGMAHDGIDNVPKEGTWLLDKGERVVDSRTNADLKNALNSGSISSGGDTHIHYSPVISVRTKEEFAQNLQEHAEHIGNIVADVKNDRMESF